MAACMSVIYLYWIMGNVEMLPVFLLQMSLSQMGLVIILLVFITLSDPPFFFLNNAVFPILSRYQEAGTVLVLYTRNNYVWVFFYIEKDLYYF